MAVLAWIGILLGALLALLLLAAASLLLVPVAVDAAWGDDRRDFALAGPGLRVSHDARTRTTELRVLGRRLGRWVSAPERRKRPERRRRRTPGPSPRKLWAQRRSVLAALRAFLRRLRFRRLSVDATLATPDPALTGWLTGAAFAVRAVVPATVRSGVTLGPDFMAETPSVALDASVRLRPVHAAVLAVRLWRVVRRARVKRGASAEDRRGGLGFVRGAARRGARLWRRSRGAVGGGPAETGNEGTGTSRRRGGGRKQR